MTGARWEVVVVGGSVAGARLAGALAAAGARVALVEPRPGIEKRCGGWLPVGLVESEPILATLDIPCHRPVGCRVETPRGARAVANPGYLVVARSDLDGALFRWALMQGAHHFETRVVALDHNTAGWRLQLADGRKLDAALVVGADGCTSLVRRQVTGRFDRDRIMICLGLTLSEPGPEVVVVLEERLVGYLWYLPRRDHVSLGICAPPAYKQGLAGRLRSFGARFGHPRPAPVRDRMWGGVFPMICDPAFYSGGLCGDDWTLVGDAAGMVNPVSGEGIRYALRSARLAARAILEGHPARYGALVADACRDLADEAYWMGKVLGAPDPVRQYRFSALECFLPVLGRYALA